MSLFEDLQYKIFAFLPFQPPGLCHTINTDDNPYGHLNEVTKRIDFIFHSNALKCVDNGLDFEEIPGSKHHYSDHKGVSALFLVEGRCYILCN